MRAEEALRKPGDAARRESDGAVAFWPKGSAIPIYCVPKGLDFDRSPSAVWRPPSAIPGEDWHPLIAAERVEELEREVEQIGKEKSRLNELITQDDDLKWEHIYHEFSLWQKIVGDHEAESHYWYTADGEIEILDSPEEVVRRRKEAAKRLVELESQIATLTAELEKARSGEAWVGERIQWGDIDAGELFLAEHTGEPRLQYCVKFSEVVADVCPNATAFYECHLPPVPRTEWRDGETVYFHGDSAMEPLIAWIDMIDRKLDQGRDGKTLSGEGRRLIKALKAIVASVAAEEAAPLPPTEPAPAKPEHKGNDYIQWVAHNRYQLTSMGAAAFTGMVCDIRSPAKLEWEEALVAWAREVAYQIATVRPTSEVEPLMVLSRELSAALEQE